MTDHPDIKVGLLFSLTGTTSITERGQYHAALLAVREINDAGGIGGARLVPVLEDISSDPSKAALGAEKLIVQDNVVALIGLYTSACRKMAIPVLEKYDRLLFYPTLYEGEEESPNVVYCGPVPNQQLRYFIPWIAEHIGSTLYLVGSDYVYPRETNRHVRRLARACGAIVVGEHYVPLGMQKFHHVVQDIQRLNPNVVFSTLVGDSLVAFYREAYHAGLHAPIASPITGETEVEAMGEVYAKGHYTSSPYFSSLSSDSNRKFLRMFAETYGTSVVSHVMESAYISVWLLAEALRKAYSTDTNGIRQALRGMVFNAPQGLVRVDDKNQHLWLQSRIGRVGDNGRFEVVWESDESIPPLPFDNDGGSTGDPHDTSPLDTSNCGQHVYGMVVDVIHDMTKYFPLKIMVVSPEGTIISMFDHQDTTPAKLPSFIHTGVRVSRDLLGDCGVTLCLMGRCEAIRCGSEHDRAELHHWITIGIPMYTRSDRFLGVLGAFLPVDQFSQEAVSLFRVMLKQVVDNALMLVEERKLRLETQRILSGLTNSLCHEYFAMQDGRVLLSNSAASTLFGSDPELPNNLWTESQHHAGDKISFRVEAGSGLFDVEGCRDDDIIHLFLNRVRTPPRYEKNGRISTQDLIGTSPEFQRCIQLAKLAARTDANVLILGESGTGKELFARAIHESSSRRDKPFVAINCAALPRDLLSAELFGYAEGAFTGAKRGGNPGKFELANGGTLFLDEIGDMPLDQQAALLRVIQEKEVVRVGGTTPISVDVRIISATNKGLTQEIAYNGSFRSDLYFRLNVFTIQLPALRQRRSDIRPLVNHFLHELSKTSGTRLKRLAEEVWEVLEAYSWPGNVRELRNAIERAFYLAGDDEVIRTQCLPDYLLQPGAGDGKRRLSPNGNVSNSAVNPYLHEWPSDIHVESIRAERAYKERRDIEQALKQFNGNITRSAKALGMSRTTLYRKLREYHMM
ncbi:MAG: transporter substrate-binding protein [Alicyclobacillus macrosporangiidus]|uniref:transporter substrate-binding protein n=1 Tax=Alicyclobacillus macrosporangiidus TaxID=392015 RepID=UPI0026ECE22C|nr:transporter substrate-binding protein [Alicyclobacillus macrosporangiidus]MCL6598494.1 transporter substrate-binding protein [Alicyclobacillus macrosporangiidus]